MNSDAWDDESKEYRRMGGSPSLASLKDNKITTPPVSNRNSTRLSSASVTIWEDASEDDAPRQPPRRSKIFSVLERIDSEGVDGNINNTDNSRGDGNGVGSSNSDRHSGVSNDYDHHNHNNNKLRSTPVHATPNDKTMGLFGFGSASAAATPASLYDRDGFLKE